MSTDVPSFCSEGRLGLRSGPVEADCPNFVCKALWYSWRLAEALFWPLYGHLRGVDVPQLRKN